MQCLHPRYRCRGYRSRQVVGMASIGYGCTRQYRQLQVVVYQVMGSILQYGIRCPLVVDSQYDQCICSAWCGVAVLLMYPIQQYQQSRQSYQYWYQYVVCIMVYPTKQLYVVVCYMMSPDRESSIVCTCSTQQMGGAIIPYTPPCQYTIDTYHTQ